MPCTVTPEDSGEKLRDSPSLSEAPLLDLGGCYSISGVYSSLPSPCVSKNAFAGSTPHAAEQCSAAISGNDVLLSGGAVPSCISPDNATASTHMTQSSPLLMYTCGVQNKSSCQDHPATAPYDNAESTQGSTSASTHSDSNDGCSTLVSGIIDVGAKASDRSNMASSSGYVQGEQGSKNSHETCGASVSKRAKENRRRDALFFFCRGDNIADTARSSSTRDGSGDEDREEALQPRNFFPFNNLFAATGWGSSRGWFFSSSGLFTTADVSSDVAEDAVASSTGEQSPAGVYITRFPAISSAGKVLPPFLSIGKVAATQKDIPGEQETLQQHGAAVSTPAAEGAVLLASPWLHERRYRGHTPTEIKRRRIDIFAKSPLSSKSVGLQPRSYLTRLQRTAETGFGGNSGVLAICMLTKRIGSVLWSRLCKPLRSRFSCISSSAGAASIASKAAKKINKVPGFFRLLKANAVGLALQDFSVREVVRDWLSSLLLSQEDPRQMPVFIGSVRADRCGRGDVAVSKRFSSEDDNADFTTRSRCSVDAVCAGSAHVFVTPEAGRLLWRSACTLILNPVTAMYFQCYRLASLGTVVYVTSVMHWWQPQLGIRRTLDVMAVCVVSGIHVVVACLYAAPLVLLLYVFLCCAGIVCYILGCYLAFRGLHKEAAVCHVGLHFLCTTANLLLYYTIAE